MHFDIILTHAPSIYDFRQRDDILFAYLSNSDSVHVSSVFEMPPVGIIALTQHLQRCGYHAEFFNVASQMLRDPDFDVETFFRKAPADIFGVDLHWLAHAQGALELARLYKEIHPSARVVVGGLSATYYHQELIAYPQVDYVIRGYDALLPLELLVEARGDASALGQVPNLTWKHETAIHVNDLTHVPSTYSAAVHWEEVFAPGQRDMIPYNLVIPQAGCEYNCRWCGGSRYFYREQMALTQPARKPPALLQRELESIANTSTDRHTITMINFWHEYEKLFRVATDVFVNPKIGTVHFSLHRLPSIQKGRRISAPIKAVIELSPDSDDPEVARASGRGAYTMVEMEAFIDALIDDVYSFEIYFMLGLPEQTVDSIWKTVDYCAHLLKKYQGRQVTPFICPMLPFLDPGSEIFEQPDQWGYTLFHRTLEDHRMALLSMHWRDRLNYETKWLSREALVDVSYEAVRALTQLKHRYGILPGALARQIVERIDSTVQILRDIDAYQALPDGPVRNVREAEIRDRIRAYNHDQFRMVRSQQRPTDLGFTKQQWWFDTEEAFHRVLAS